MILNEIMGYPVELKAFHPCYNFSGERYRKNLLHEYKVHDEKLFEYIQDVIEMWNKKKLKLQVKHHLVVDKII